MIDREKVIKGLETHTDKDAGCEDCPYCHAGNSACVIYLFHDALEVLKEQKNEYENGFNDAMQGRQELMYEGTDGKWYKKDW